MSLRSIICVDLDHTLIHTDITRSLAWAFLRKGGVHAWMQMVRWIIQGLMQPSGCSMNVKAHLIHHMSLDAETLPYDAVVLEELHHWKRQGHTLVLATGAHQHWAQQVADYLGLFDEVLGTQTCNLIGPAKAQALITRYGEKEFMYYGDSKVDLHVWRHAHSGVAVNPSLQVRLLLKYRCPTPIRILQTIL